MSIRWRNSFDDCPEDILNSDTEFCRCAQDWVWTVYKRGQFLLSAILMKKTTNMSIVFWKIVYLISNKCSNCALTVSGSALGRSILLMTGTTTKSLENATIEGKKKTFKSLYIWLKRCKKSKLFVPRSKTYFPIKPTKKIRDGLSLNTRVGIDEENDALASTQRSRYLRRKIHVTLAQEEI